MMKPDKKEMVSIILGGLKPKKDEGYHEGHHEDSEMEMALHDSMDRFIAAVSSKNTSQAVSALKDFIYMCDED